MLDRIDQAQSPASLKNHVAMFAKVWLCSRM